MVSSYYHECYREYAGCNLQPMLTERHPISIWVSYTQPKGEIVFMYKATARCPNSSPCWKRTSFVLLKIKSELWGKKRARSCSFLYSGKTSEVDWFSNCSDKLLWLSQEIRGDPGKRSWWGFLLLLLFFFLLWGDSKKEGKRGKEV